MLIFNFVDVALSDFSALRAGLDTSSFWHLQIISCS